MAMLVIHTQYRENYGAHDWDGEGIPPQHWKNKGGGEYLFPLGNKSNDWYSSSEIDPFEKHVENEANGFNAFIDEAAKLISYKNPASEEFPMYFNILEDNYRGEYEESALKDGDFITLADDPTPVIRKIDGVWKLIRRWTDPRHGEIMSTNTISDGNILTEYKEDRFDSLVWEMYTK